MRINKDMIENTVDAEKQVNEKCKIVGTEGIRILFLGNSVTWHERAPQIGWNHNWGMAASAEEKDYVHLVVDFFKKRYGKIRYCVCNVGKWEQNFFDESVLEEFVEAKEFEADVVVSRLGENVAISKLGEYDFSKRYESFLRYFTKSAKKVLVTDLFWEHETLDRQIKELAEKEGYTFVSIVDLGYDDENKALGQYPHEGVCLHPNDVGMRKIADRIIAGFLATEREGEDRPSACAAKK